MKYLLLVTILIFLGITNAKPVFAHVLATDKNIGAVLHINPDDDPIAGQQASFYFEFKDKQGKFIPQNCDCIFTILENSKKIYSQPLFQNNTNPNLQNASVFYTFPKSDVYQIKVTGKPLTQKTFQPFMLTYDIRVEKGENENVAPTTDNWLMTHVQHIGISVAGIIALLFLLMKNQTNKSSLKGGEKHNEKDNRNTY